MKNPTAILTGDIHLREDQPTCRLDDFWEAQSKAINWLRKLQEKHQCLILDAGDLFHKWRSSNFLARWAILNLPNNMITLWGNHDTPYHNLNNYEKSILGVLAVSGRLKVIRESTLTTFDDLDLGMVYFPWGTEPAPISPVFSYNIAVMHTMVYKGKTPWPGCTAPNARQLLTQMRGFDLVVTGHNHRTFVEEHKGRLLVNPGSLTQQTADQADHKPCVFLWDAEHNEVEQVFLPIEEGVVSREHIDVENEKNERLSAFIERMNKDIEVELSFEKNLERYLESNKVRKGTKNILSEVLNG